MLPTLNEVGLQGASGRESLVITGLPRWVFYISLEFDLLSQDL